jgi:hypothetical protein
MVMNGDAKKTAESSPFITKHHHLSPFITKHHYALSTHFADTWSVLHHRLAHSQRARRRWHDRSELPSPTIASLSRFGSRSSDLGRSAANPRGVVPIRAHPWLTSLFSAGKSSSILGFRISGIRDFGIHRDGRNRKNRNVMTKPAISCQNLPKPAIFSGIVQQIMRPQPHPATRIVRFCQGRAALTATSPREVSSLVPRPPFEASAK